MDACDEIMEAVNLPKGDRHASEENIEKKQNLSLRRAQRIHCRIGDNNCVLEACYLSEVMWKLHSSNSGATSEQLDNNDKKCFHL